MMLKKLSFLVNIEQNLHRKVQKLYSTDYGESSEKSHGSSNCRQHVHKLCCSVLCDSVKCWGIKGDPHISEFVFPLEF